jgi:hypothetical protein
MFLKLIIIIIKNIILYKFKTEYIYLCFCFRNFPNFLYLPILKINKKDLDYIEDRIKNMVSISYFREIFLNTGINALAIIDNNFEYFSISLK